MHDRESGCKAMKEMHGHGKDNRCTSMTMHLALLLQTHPYSISVLCKDTQSKALLQSSARS